MRGPSLTQTALQAADSLCQMGRRALLALLGIVVGILEAGETHVLARGSAGPPAASPARTWRRPRPWPTGSTNSPPLNAGASPSNELSKAIDHAGSRRRARSRRTIRRCSRPGASRTRRTSTCTGIRASRRPSTRSQSTAPSSPPGRGTLPVAGAFSFPGRPNPGKKTSAPNKSCPHSCGAPTDGR